MRDNEIPTIIATVGGKGTRLYPLTLAQPKALVNMCGRAVVDRAFEILAKQGCRRFIIGSAGYENTTRIKEYFKEGKGFSGRLKLRPEVIFKYQPNYRDRGNADAVRYCIEYYDITNDVLVISGDNIIDINLKDMVRFHRDRGSLLTIRLKELEAEKDISQFGVAELDKDRRIIGFVEKPKENGAPSRFINTAIYLFSPEIRRVFREMGDKVRDIGGDVIPYLIENGYPVYGYECRPEGYWSDVGTPRSFLKTAQDMLRGKIGRIEFDNKQTIFSKIGETFMVKHDSGGKRVHNSTLDMMGSSDNVQIGKYVQIGANCSIGSGVKIESSYIGDNCIIEDRTSITGSIVMDFVDVGKNVRLNRCIVGRYSSIEDNSVVDGELDVDISTKILDRAPVIGENVTIFKGSIIGPGKRVAPIYESHRILSAGRFMELGYDEGNIYFVEK